VWTCKVTRFLSAEEEARLAGHRASMPSEYRQGKEESSIQDVAGGRALGEDLPRKKTCRPTRSIAQHYFKNPAAGREVGYREPDEGEKGNARIQRGETGHRMHATGLRGHVFVHGKKLRK